MLVTQIINKLQFLMKFHFVFAIEKIKLQGLKTSMHHLNNHYSKECILSRFQIDVKKPYAPNPMANRTVRHCSNAHTEQLFLCQQKPSDPQS